MNNLKDLKKTIEKIINKHNAGLLATNFGKDLAKMSFLQPDCLAMDLIPLFEAESKKAEEKIIKEIIEDLNNLWLKEAHHGEYWTDDFIPQGWTMSGHIIPVIRKKLDHLLPKGETK